MLAGQLAHARLNLPGQLSLALCRHAHHGHAQIGRPHEQGLITGHGGDFLQMGNGFHAFNLEDLPYLVFGDLQVGRFRIHAVMNGAQRADAALAAVGGVGAGGDGGTGDLRAVDEGEDDPVRAHVQDVLDLLVLHAGDADKGAGSGGLGGHHMMVHLPAIHHAVLCVDPGEVAAGIADDLADGGISQLHKHAHDGLPVPDFFLNFRKSGIHATTLLYHLPGRGPEGSLYRASGILRVTVVPLPGTDS